MLSGNRHLLLLKRKRAILQARRELVAFTQLMMADPEHPEDPDRTLYDAQKFHRVMGAALEEIESENYRRLMINLGPRFGKTTLASAMFPAWYIGKHPDRSIIVATYNQHYSWDLGRKIRDIIRLPQYAQVFPELSIKPRADAVDRIETTKDGVIFMVGRGSSITGRGGHLILLDDPIKDRKEADSQLIRDSLWTWYTQVLRSRLMNKKGAIVIIQTRWTEDDLVGRLIDPMSPYYTVEEAKLWKKIDLPAIAEDNDILGREPGEALWPARFDEKYLEEIRVTDARGFAALYQGRPAPKEGAFFRNEDLVPYQAMSKMPHKDDMRFYAACDLAVSLDQKADKTCLMVVGVDQNDHLWIMHDLFWRRTDSAGAVEAMIALMAKYRPHRWWGEKGQISRSIGPFLTKRMREKQVHCAMEEINPTQDKQQRAQAIQARSAMQMVHFPSWTSWWPEAHDQLLKFPHGTRDDFVDALALIGLGLAKMRPRQKQKVVEAPRTGTFAEMKEQTRQRERRTDYDRGMKGWI
jgi:predicted phage terminase large subunit-like protein